MDEKQIDEIVSLAKSSSGEKRWRAIERYQNLADELKCHAALRLFASEYKDVRESVLETCTGDVVSGEKWQKAMAEFVAEDPPAESAQYILVCMQRMDLIKEQSLKDFYRKCLHSNDMDIAYQAFCVAELCGEDSEAYLELVRKWLDSSDSDFRIVSIQAITRLKPSWGEKALDSRSTSANGVEGFHLLLARISLAEDEEKRRCLLDKVVDVLPDERYAFPAIQALSDYDVKSAIPSLLKMAHSFFAEPTIRVAAAGAAAKLGSEDGMSLLKKFASSGHENPSYAKELLNSLEAVKSNGDE